MNVILNFELSQKFELTKLLRNPNPNCYSVHLGIHDRSKPESWSVTRMVKKVTIHENFDSENLRNDIALLHLEVSSLELSVRSLIRLDIIKQVD